MTEQKLHAKSRPPSAAKRWLSCPYSAALAAMYPNMPTEASLKGDYEHNVMEDTVRWNAVPTNVEPDLYETMGRLLEYVRKRKAEMGPNTIVIIERTLDIPETGEFGTCDIALISDREIEVIDHKSGWVPVHVRLNPQLMLYLLGIIALYGERKHYKITVHQDTYDHIDGPIRSDDVTPDDIEWLRSEIKYSIEHSDECKAGKHCKETYCPHRGACAPFAEYTLNDAGLGWHTSEIKALSDDLLSEALDHAETLAGYRDELRKEAMRRILNMDRRVTGYKIVKGRKQRATRDPLKLAEAMRKYLGDKYAKRMFPTVAEYLPEDFQITEGLLKHICTPKQVEDIIKQYAKDTGAKRGEWQALYTEITQGLIIETTSGLTLEKAIDGRPAHKRGSEFGVLPSLDTANTGIKII